MVNQPSPDPLCAGRCCLPHHDVLPDSEFIHHANLQHVHVPRTAVLLARQTTVQPNYMHMMCI